MFPLHTKSFPTSAPELARLMNESVQRVFITTTEPVTIQGGVYPSLESVGIRLDDARLLPEPTRPPVVSGGRAPALHVQDLHLEGSRIALGPATADLRLHARDVRFDQARDAENGIVLLLQSAASGEVQILADKAELEKAIAALASQEAGKQGVTLEDVSLKFHERGARSLSGEVQVKARKLFFSTVIRIAADLDLDDELNATISGLVCKGDGAIGMLACGVLAPHLQKLDGRTFSLLALPLGDIRLRDVRISSGEMIGVSAEFGV